RIEQSQIGTLEDLPGMPQTQMKILRASRVSADHKQLILGDPAVAEVGRVYRFEGASMPIVGTGSIVARVQPDLSADQLASLWKSYPTSTVELFGPLSNVYIIHASDNEDEVSVAESLASDPRVVWAQPNFRRLPKLTQISPGDPYFSSQWHLKNT